MGGSKRLRVLIGHSSRHAVANSQPRQSLSLTTHCFHVHMTSSWAFQALALPNVTTAVVEHFRNALKFPFHMPTAMQRSTTPHRTAPLRTAPHHTTTRHNINSAHSTVGRVRRKSRVPEAGRRRGTKCRKRRKCPLWPMADGHSPTVDRRPPTLKPQLVVTVVVVVVVAVVDCCCRFLFL